MKTFNVLTLCFLVLLIASCSNTGEERSAYEQLLHSADSLQKRVANLKTAHDSIAQAHQQLSQQLATLDSVDVDSTWLEDLARHEVILKNHEATLDAQEQIMASHSEFRNKQDQASKAEFQAQIQAMKQGHDEIKSTLNQIQNEHQTLNDEHASIRNNLSERASENESSQ